MKDISLYTGDEIYRPFWERDSVFLEITLGCSWHRCAFCDFARDTFSAFSLDQIEKKTKKLIPYAEGKDRIFLLGDNPFVLNTPKLLAIFDLIQFYLPWIKEVSMYARFDDILSKDIRQLKVLKQHGLTALHIGLESGSNLVLELMNKGITAEESKLACSWLWEAGISYYLTVIPGLGGKALSDVHVCDTSSFLNQVQPAKIWFSELKVWPDTQLAKMCEDGRFEPLGKKERLQEAYRLLRQLEQVACSFADTSILDQYTLIGKLPDNKEQLLAQMKRFL